MADLNYDVSANTTGAIRSLDQLNSKVKGLGNTFSGLQRIISGLAVGNFIRQTLAYADSIDDLAQATGIATSTIVGFGQAVSRNGGNAEAAQAAINKLVLSVGEAAEGGKAAQLAFGEVGVTLTDLATLSEEDIFKKTIAGLAKIEDVSRRSRLQNELLGKSLRGVNLQGVAGSMGGFAAAANPAAIKAGADAYQNLQNGLESIKKVLLDILAPINRFVASIDTTSKSFEKWIRAIVYAGTALATFLLIILPIGRALGTIWAAIRALDTGLRGIARIPLKDIFKGLFGGETATKNLEKLKAVAADLAKRMEGIPGIGKSGALKIGKDLFDRLKGKLDSAYDSAKKLLATLLGVVGIGGAGAIGFNTEGEQTGNRRNIRGVQDRIDRDKAIESQEEYARKLREVQDAFAKQVASIRQVSVEYNRLTAEQIANININRLSLDMSEDEIAVQEAVTEVIRRNEDAIRGLQQQKAQLGKEDEKLIGVINGQITALRNRLEADKANTAEAVRNLNAVRIEQEKLRLELEATNQLYRDNAALQSIQDQIALIGLYGEELENNRIALEVTQELQGKLLDLQERLADLENRRKQIGEERYQNELDNINKLIQRAYEYAGVRIELEQQVLDAQKAAQQDWMGAINAQIEDLAKQFTPVQLATDLFKSAINGIDNALTDFIQKGKFNFKDFASSILRDMALIIARALIMRAILSVLGIFSPTAAASLSSMVGIPGRAKGGPVGSNKMYMVGEEGPELFIPRTAGNIIPNNQMAMATAQSAPQVTYNINATDAQSFRALIARDPSFIYNVTEVGRRSSPARRLA